MSFLLSGEIFTGGRVLVDKTDGGSFLICGGITNGLDSTDGGTMLIMSFSSS